MLIQFSFKNFKSFRDDNILDLSATRITEHSNHVIKVGKGNSLLPIAAVFGANASGKSNLLEAFDYMSIYVVNSFAYGGEEKEKRSSHEFIKPTPFILDKNSRDAESSFEVYFIDAETERSKIYNYGFTINKTGILDVSGIPTKAQTNIKIALEKETLIVSLGAKLKIAKLKRIRDWFFNNEIVNFGLPIESFILSEQLPYGFVKDNNVRQNVLDYFAAFDPSIIGFEVESLDPEDSSDDVRVRIDAIHKMIDSDEIAMIPLKLESAGTLKMFNLYQPLQDVLDIGGVLFVDELNSKLHPLLVRTLIIMFLNPEINKNNAQLVYTTHDTWQLENNSLRRDEIWFVEKSDEGISTLYSLADFFDEKGDKIRKDENYGKNYLLGKYGAIPKMKDFDMFEEGKSDV
jgi:Predicted ATPases